MSEQRRTAVAAFLLTFVAIVAIGSVVGVISGGDSGITELTEIENPQYDAERVSPDVEPGTATIQMDADGSGSKIVVKAGGGVSERDIEPLVNTLVDSGAEVSVLSEEGLGPVIGPQIGSVPQRPVGPAPSPDRGDDERSLSDELSDADGFVSVGASNYNQEDIDAISEFVENDGQMVMAVNPQQEFTASGLPEVYSELGAYTKSGYVYNLEENDLNYQRIYAEPAGQGTLTDGVGRVVLDTATPVEAAGSDELLRPIDGSVLSTTRDSTNLPVFIRDDNVAMIGDTGFLTPENTQRADNDVFVGNLADFLVSGDRTTSSSGSGETSTSASGNASSDTVTVEVGPDGENVFEPQYTEIEPGTTVRFEWKSGGHNLVPLRQQPEDHEWDGVEEIQDEGYVHEVTFEEVSAHEFTSEPYQDEGMVGVVVVGNPEPPA